MCLCTGRSQDWPLVFLGEVPERVSSGAIEGHGRLQGQGGCWVIIHKKVPICPLLLAAAEVASLQGQPSDRSHASNSVSPQAAASRQKLSHMSRGHVGFWPQSHCTTFHCLQAYQGICTEGAI